ncbi:hypothetical protein FSP39_013848 [Pinctada imbricata]|uniref:Ig-like domain-containing protein n=1 Tax=Pinctada imbricata TaxID=66713 RepID=A0AA89BMB6_PINIB|nr:hypothetical protein FSP39_013848 [Pinctada imbricata]
MLTPALCVFLVVSLSSTVVTMPNTDGAFIRKRELSSFQELESYNDEFLPLVPQLVRSSATTVDTNGVTLFTLDVIEADQSDCIFSTFEHEEVGMNLVYRDGNRIKGILLVKQKGPHHVALFTCYSKYQPIGAQYLLKAYSDSESLNATRTTEGYDCMMSKPRHVTLENTIRIEIFCMCTHNVTKDNDVTMVMEGAVLIDGKIYELREKYALFNYADIFEMKEGMMKASFIFPKNFSRAIDVLPTFSLRFKDKLRGDLRIRKTHFITDDKSLDGTRPAVRRGNLAMSMYPESKGTLYLRRGSTKRLSCVAYGNPKPNLALYKDDSSSEGRRDLDLIWNHFSNYKYITLDAMDESFEGRYTCNADTGMKRATKTVDVHLCVPANVFHTTVVGTFYLIITLTATYNETNKIERTNCYRSEADDLTWLGDSITEEFRDDNHWNRTYSIRRNMVQMPLTVHCYFEALCKMDKITFVIDE